MRLVRKTHCLRGHEYAVTGRTSDGHCKPCRHEHENNNPARRERRKRRWRERNPEKVLAIQRANDLKRKGMTVEEYKALFIEQGFRCAICRKAEYTKRKGTVMQLAVDHDHLTGEKRGLLCCNCNRALGLFGDNIQILLAAIDYLKEWSMRNRRQLAVSS